MALHDRFQKQKEDKISAQQLELDRQEKQTLANPDARQSRIKNPQI